MPAESPDDNGPAAEHGLSGVAAVLQRLAAAGLGPAIGLSADWRRRSAVGRVARFGPDELARRLDVIYSSQRASLVGYATGILGNRPDAEDVVNEAFARVLRADPDLQVPEALVGYVRTVVRNQARDRGSESSRDRASRQPQDLVDLDARLASPDRPVEDRVCDELTVGVALHMLSARQRQCVLLRFVHGLSVKETAARLGVSEGNVKRICHEVRSRIAQALDAA